MLTSGFPSPAEDFREKELVLDDLFVKNPSATFFLRASGENDDLTGIYEGDILIVDRSITPDKEDLVICSSGEGLMVQTYSGSPTGPDRDLPLWGVITWVIHSLKK